MVWTCVHSPGAATGSSDGEAGALGSSDGDGSADGEAGALGDGLALGDGSPDAVSGSRVRKNASTRPAITARAIDPTDEESVASRGAESVDCADSVIGIFLRAVVNEDLMPVQTHRFGAHVTEFRPFVTVVSSACDA